MKRDSTKKWYSISIARIPIYVILLAWTATEMFILIWMTYSSFKTNTQIYQNFWALPGTPNLNGYYWDLTGTGNPPVALGHYLVNSSIVAFASVAGILAIAIPAGYAISKKSRLTTILFYVFLAMIAIPAPALLIPQLLLIRDLGLYNTFLGLILPYIAFNIPFSIVLARAFFRSFPKELEEAARMDGLSDFGILVRIVLPLSSIIVVVLAIVNFPNIWNELLYAIVIVPSDTAKTVQPGLLLFNSTFLVSWQNIFAGLVLTSLPMIIFYIIFQRYIVKAVFVGAIKG
jgi:raffinose/stachyose/melibiose transport system permease protein